MRNFTFAILYFLRQQYINLANKFVTTKLDFSRQFRYNY